MKKQPRPPDILIKAMFLCFGLALLSFAVYWGGYLYYQLFSGALETPYDYYAEYFDHVHMPRQGKIWLVSCGMTIFAAVLLMIYGVCRHRKTIEMSPRVDLATILCSRVLAMPVWLVLDILVRVLAT